MHRNFYKSVFFFFSSGKFIAAMRDTETALLCIVDFYARFFSSNNFPPPSHLFFRVSRAFLPCRFRIFADFNGNDIDRKKRNSRLSVVVKP